MTEHKTHMKLINYLRILPKKEVFSFVLFIYLLFLISVPLFFSDDLLASDPPTCDALSSIGSNFNGTQIAGGNYIWFNSIVKVSGLGSDSATIHFAGSTIQFIAGGNNYELNVPPSEIIFSPTAITATTVFADGKWVTTVPLNYSGNVFLSGLVFQSPSGGLPGGINPVTWSGYFMTDTAGVSVQWKWAAAVYMQFSTDCATLGVKPVDGNQLSEYNNSDHAGTPENFKPYVIGGARGGGGSNFTGSYSGTASKVPCLDTTGPELTVSTLSDGSWTNNELLNVSGIVKDNIGIQQLTINDTVVAINADGSFSQQVTLHEGANTITVKAEDLAGNQASDTRTINLDRNAPNITIITPADNIKTKQSPVDVAGVVDEQATVMIRLNGADPIAAVMNGNNFSLTVALASGNNTIEVTATDLVGNTSAVTRMVTLDNLNPSLSVTNPPQDIKTNQAALLVKGEVGDLTAVTVTITVDGNIYTPVVTGGNFEQTVTFTSEKTYLIYIKATDEAGNETVVQRNVMYDATAPTVALDPVTSPTNLNSQVLSGTMEAGTTVSVLCTTATVGTVIYPTATTWTAALSNIHEGDNAISITATDETGNTSQTVSSNITVDMTQPVTPTIDLLPEATNSMNISVSGSAEPGSRIKIVGSGETNSDSSGRFTITVTLVPNTLNTFSVTAVDQVGNESQPVTFSILQDSVSPGVTGFSLLADPKETLLIPVSITFTETVDPSTVNSSNISITGASGSVEGSFSISGAEVIFTPGSDLPANETFTLSVSQGIKDKAGNNLASPFTATFDTLRGTSFILGEVYDDTIGLPIEGAEVRILKIKDTIPDPIPSLQTDSTGRFRYEYQGAAGNILIEVKKEGYTKCIRTGSLFPNKSSSIFDVRLTPVEGHSITAVDGGTINSGDATISIPPLSLSQDANVSLTPLNQQGSGVALPLGWSPLYGVDISPWNAIINLPASLTIKNNWSLTDTGQFIAARFSDTTNEWVKGNASLSEDNIIIEITDFGQYIILVPDTFPSPPPFPQNMGDPVQPSSDVIPDSGTAIVEVIPPAVFSRDGAQGMTTVKVTTENPVPSGTPIKVKITERYDLKSGERVTPESFVQDITLFYSPDGIPEENTLYAHFPTTPSRIYPIGSITYGKVDIEVFLFSGIEKPEEEVIGENGGTVTGSDGSGIVILPSSLTTGTVFMIYPLTESQLPISSPQNLTFAGALTIQMEGGSFKQDAFPQFILPGLQATEGTKIIATRVEQINGKEELKAVATGRVASGKVSIERCVSTSSTCILSGRYAFYIPARAFGFISGSVLKSGSALSGAVLNVDNLPFKAVTDSSGNFIILSLISNYSIKALESGTGLSASAIGDIGDGETKNIVLNLSAISPEVISVVPSDKATNVAVKSQIKVTFSTSIDTSTINTGTFEILEMPTPLSQSPISGHISLASGNTMAVFTPDSELKANMSYKVKLSSVIKDTFGNALIPFESVFTTSEILDNDALPAGALKVSMPDADGYVTVRGGAGLAAPETPVVIINKTKNIVLTVVANNDGSFEGRIKASITDEIIVQVKDLLNNTTTLSPGLFMNDDGTAAVGPNGGTIYGPGGIKAVIPEGAFDTTLAVKVAMVPEETVENVIMNPELRTGGVFQVDTGGVEAKNEIKISVPAPEWITPDHQILIAKVVNIRGFDELTLTCPGILKEDETGRTIESTTPPFDGIKSGTYEIVSWADPEKGVGYALIDSWNTQEIGYMIGEYDFIFQIPSFKKKTIVITVPINRLANIDIKSLSGETLQTISIQGPPARGQFAEGIQKVTFDNTPPSVYWNSIDGSAGVLPTDNYFTIEMTEEVDKSTVECNPACQTVIVKDSHGNIVEGSVYLAEDGKTIVFVPKYGYKYDETYTIELNGVKDWGGNAVTYTSSFSTFQPEVIATIDVPFAMAIDKYKNYIVVKGDDSSSGLGLTMNSLIKIIDVTDPYTPQVTSSFYTYGYVRDIKAFVDGSNDYLVAVGGKISKYGFLDMFDITDPFNPTYREEIYLGWNPSYQKVPDYVPYDAGEPQEVALIDGYAYSATLGIGVQAVALSQVVPPHNIAQQNAIIGTATGTSTYAVSPIKTNILAIKDGGLSILNAQTAKIGEFKDLNSPFSVTGVGDFPIDIDDDRNYGDFEDNDGDDVTSQDETFDLAFVSTHDGIVIIDVTKPDTPKKMDLIPIQAGKVEVDRDRRMAFGDGLVAISLKDLKPPANPSQVGGLIDTNGDGIDDRLLYTYPDASGMDIVINDMGGSLFAYVADYAGGLLKVVKLNKPELKIALVDENGIVLPKDYKIQIHNNSNGDPEMPVLRARIMPLDPKDINQFLYSINPELIGSEICWDAKVEYIVPLSGKHADKSRHGLDPSVFGTDGFVLRDAVISVLCKDGIKGIGPELNISDSGTNTWGGNFGGGKLTITASILKTKAPTVLPHNGTIEGERTTDQFRTQMITYLKQAGRTPPIETELGSADVLFALACVETYGINHFYPPAVKGDGIPDGSEYGLPIGSNYPLESRSGDGGFGVMQLTEPSPSYIQIWHWKLNIDAGVEVVKEKIRIAQKLSSSIDQEHKRMSVYALFRGGLYYKWDYDKALRKNNWIPRLDKNDLKRKQDYLDSGVYHADKAEINKGKNTCQ